MDPTAPRARWSLAQSIIVACLLVTLALVGGLTCEPAAAQDVVLDPVPSWAKWHVQVLIEGRPPMDLWSVRRPRPLSGGWLRIYPNPEPGGTAEDIYFGAALLVRVAVIP